MGGNGGVKTMSANVVDSIFISLGLDVTEFASAFQQIQKNVGSALTVVNDFSTGLAKGITDTAHDMSGLITATENAKKELEEAGKSGAKGMEAIGNEADKTNNKIEKTESSAKKLGKSLGATIKSLLTNIVAPMTALLAVGSIARSYTSDLETLDALTKKTGLSMEEQAEKQKLLARYSKEDLQLYQDGKKALKEFGEALQEAFRPILKIVVPALSLFSNKLLDLIKYCKEHKAFIIPFFAGIATVIAMALIPTLKALEFTATKAFIGFMRPLLPLIALVAAVALVLEDLWVFMQGGDSALGRLMAKFGATKETIENTRATVKKMFDLLQEFYPQILAVFGAIMAKSIAFKTFTTVVTSASKALGFASTAIRGVALAFRVMTVAIASNPIGAIIIALIAIISACIFYWDDLKEAGISAWEWIKSIWSNAPDFFKSVVNGILAPFRLLKEFLINLIPDSIKDLLGIDGGRGVGAIVSEVEDKLTNMVADLVPEGITETIATAGDALKNFGSGVADFFSFSTPAYAVSPSSIHTATSNNTEVTTNMGGVTIEVKSTDPMRAGDNVKNELETLVNTANYGVNQK